MQGSFLREKNLKKCVLLVLRREFTQNTYRFSVVEPKWVDERKKMSVKHKIWTQHGVGILIIIFQYFYVGLSHEENINTLPSLQAVS